MKKVNVLFICKYNRFRSKVGEALLKKLAGDRVNIRSRGVVFDLNYVADNVKIALREKGVKRVDNKPRVVGEEDIDWADKIIVNANNVDASIFPADKTEIWLTPDSDQSDLERIREIVNYIEEKVFEFAGSLKK